MRKKEVNKEETNEETKEEIKEEPNEVKNEVKNVDNKKIISKTGQYIKLAMIIMSICLSVLFFLPIGAGTKQHVKQAERLKESIAIEECNYTYGDLKDVSMLELANIYRVLMNSEDTYDKGESIICFVLILVIGGISLLEILFSVLRRPVPALILDIIVGLAFYTLMWDLNDRRVLPGRNYDLGIANYLYYVLMGGLFILSIVCVIVKRKEKKCMNL